MSLYLPQISDLIERCLKQINLFSPSALNLLLGTAAQESALGKYIRQYTTGGETVKDGGHGIFQMEPATEADIWKNYLRYKPDLSGAIFAVVGYHGPDPWKLETDLAYQIIMARVHYLRVPAALPYLNPLKTDHTDFVAAIAAYWKRHYNTMSGKGTEKEFINNFNRYVGKVLI